MVDGKICPVVESNGSGNYKQNHQMVITLRERERMKKSDEIGVGGMSRRKERKRKTRGERKTKKF